MIILFMTTQVANSLAFFISSFIREIILGGFNTIAIVPPQVLLYSTVHNLPQLCCLKQTILNRSYQSLFEF